MSTTLTLVAAKCARDLMNRVGAEHPAVYDYIDRAHKDICDYADWEWMLGDRKVFLTRKGVTEYWFTNATIGTNAGVHQTSLSIADFDRFQETSIRNLSTGARLFELKERPSGPNLARRDSTQNPGRPIHWRWDPTLPDQLSIYPPSDNLNSYKPVPKAPIVSTVVSGALAARTYYVAITLIDAKGGESTLSPETSIYIPASSLVTVEVPPVEIAANASGVSYSGYNVYVGTVSGTLTKQNTSTVTSISGVDWTEPGSGLIAGTASPTTSTIVELEGYLIEFRYYKTTTALTSAAHVPQVPDNNIRALVARANQYLCSYLDMEQKYMAYWAKEYNEALKDLVRDLHRMHESQNFIAPDYAATVGFVVNPYREESR